ncbi:MAG: hypothetical protein CMN77_15900 [Spirochaetaceae bacterium]|nr:hypothetical protein [Spirochaetaceae bacterium]
MLRFFNASAIRFVQRRDSYVFDAVVLHAIDPTLSEPREARFIGSRFKQPLQGHFESDLKGVSGGHMAEVHNFGTMIQ